MDGLVAAVMITTMEDVDSVALIHPQDITDGKFEIRKGDIMANLPYHPNCSTWFDHHELTASNLNPPEGFKGKHALAPSVARVVYEYYGPDKMKRYEELIAETDRFDSAQLSIEDVADPQGAILLGFTVDPRTGLGDFKYYFLQLVELLKSADMEDVLKHPEVARRAKLYRESNSEFMSLLKKYSHSEGNVIVTDFRDFSEIPIGNRFLVYTLFQECDVSVRLEWDSLKEFVRVSIGHSIFNRTCETNVGHLCSDFGGGGHRGAGGCLLDPETAESDLDEIIRRLREGPEI